MRTRFSHCLYENSVAEWFNAVRGPVRSTNPSLDPAATRGWEWKKRIKVLPLIMTETRDSVVGPVEFMEGGSSVAYNIVGSRNHGAFDARKRRERLIARPLIRVYTRRFRWYRRAGHDCNGNANHEWKLSARGQKGGGEFAERAASAVSRLYLSRWNVVISPSDRYFDTI